MPYTPPERWQPHVPETEYWPGVPDAWEECALAAERGGFAARAWVEPPEGWGPVRLLMTSLRRQGYEVEEHRTAQGVRLRLC